jgi:hypothetical protein
MAKKTTKSAIEGNARTKSLHEKKVDRALSAINKVFSDTSVDKETTIKSLQRLVMEIALNIDTIRDEIGQQVDEGPGHGFLPPAEPAE